MHEETNMDDTLRILGRKGAGWFSIQQMLLVVLGSLGAASQLLINIFVGRAVEGLQCAPPGNQTFGPEDERYTVVNLDWNSSNVVVGQCEITVLNGNLSEDAQSYPCPNGYQYGYDRDLSFRTEFDLVCDRKLLGSLVQTLVIAGQGIGAMVASVISDRYGRKPILIGSQFGLLVVGIGVGMAPSYAVMAVLKFLIGGFQQGVVTGMATMGIELFPVEYRSLELISGSLIWGATTSSLALVAYLMSHLSWRYLQYAVSAVSLLVCLVQLLFVEESLRWLVANGKKDAVIRVLKKAARANRKDFNVVLNSLQGDAGSDAEEDKELTALPTIETEAKDNNKEEEKEEEGGKGHEGEERKNGYLDDPSHPHVPTMCEVETTLTDKQTRKMTVLDIFRHKRLLGYAVIAWLGWYTCAFSYFSLYVMSTTLHGDRFLNFFLASVMDFPSSIMLYYLVDKVGRRHTSSGFFALTGIGLITCGIFRVFKDNSLLGTLSVVSNTLGALGATSVFTGIFFFTPEFFPTNVRNQALGASSFAGRLGGMMGPFMTDLAEIAVWAPGALAGGLCLLVTLLFQFLPETKSHELPDTIDDIKAWSAKERKPSE